MNFLAVFALTPLFPEVARDLHLGPDGFGALFLLQTGISLVLQLPAGLLADSVDRRKLIAFGLACMTTGQLLRWQAQDWTVFGLGQVFIGLSTPFIVGSTFALVASAYPSARRVKAFGILQLAANLGQGLGLLAAGLLSPMIGWRGFSLSAAVLPVLLIPLALRISEPTDASALESGTGLKGALRLFFASEVLIVTAAAALLMFTWTSAVYLEPFVARAQGIAAVTISLLLGCNLLGSALGGVLAGRWADRVGTRIPGFVFCSAGAIGLLSLPLFGFLPLLAATVNLGIGAAVSAGIALGTSAVADHAAARGQGTGAAIAVMRTGQTLGSAVGPILIGVTLVHLGAGLSFVMMGATLAVAGALLAVDSSAARGPARSARTQKQ